jgi:hypothetical protein
MIMSSDPYRAPEIAPDVPIRDLPQATDPLRVVEPAGRTAALWIPIAIALAFAIGVAYYHFDHTNVAPNVHTSAVPVSPPNPN